MITGSLLYNLVECSHRIYQDLFADAAMRDPVSKFVQLLWERGTAFEAEVIASLGISFTNLRNLSPEERERRTDYAMEQGDTLIYGGRIGAGDLLGEPDLLRKQASGYVAGDINSVVRGSKTIISGVGPDTLARFQERAQLQKGANSQPYLRKRLELPDVNTELFFDIEADPMRRDICYLHGFLERRDGDLESEKYIPFLAETPTEEQEREAFAKAFKYIRSRAPCVIYYYSKYERTWWRKLQKRYPMVASEDDVEAIFKKTTAVDLFYDVVQPSTVWPTHDHSIKTLASYLGFKWRDPSPSGADSIEWYHRWMDTGDKAVRQRILEYNEDDCRATRVLLDRIRGLRVRGDH